MNELEHIDSEMANNYYTKELIQIIKYVWKPVFKKKTGWESESVCKQVLHIAMLLLVVNNFEKAEIENGVSESKCKYLDQLW